MMNLTTIYLKEFLPQVGSKKYFYDIVNGVLFLAEIEVYNKNIDFIVTDENELLLGIGHFKLNKKCKSLLMAGELIISSEGKIKYANNNSGHYKPSHDEFMGFIEELKRTCGYLLDENFEYDIKNW
jgi:hypothetical protein